MGVSRLVLLSTALALVLGGGASAVPDAAASGSVWRVAKPGLSAPGHPLLIRVQDEDGGDDDDDGGADDGDGGGTDDDGGTGDDGGATDPGGDDGFDDGGGVAGDDDGPAGDDDGPAADDDGPAGDDAPAGPAGTGDDDDGPAAQDDGRDDDGPGVGDDSDPEFAPYDDGLGGGPRPLADDEILDDDGDLARRGQIMVLSPGRRVLRDAARLGLTVVRRERLPGTGGEIVILAVPQQLTVREALRQLRAKHRRTIFDYNHLYGFKPTAVGLGGRKRGLGPPERTPLTLSDTVTVGIIDSGIDLTHETLRGARIEQKAFIETTAAPADHGTAVASLVIGQQGGLAPRARVVAASIFSVGLSGEASGAALQLVQAIDFMVANRVPVINLSLAGPDNAVVAEAVARALKSGHVLVAAVGNEGPGAKPLYPASYDGVIGVTAIDKRDRVYRRAGRGPQVDVSAYGVDIHCAAGKGYGVHSGTSFASPWAAVALAAAHPKPDRRRASRLASEFAATLRDLGAPGRDDIFGHGALLAR